MMRRSFFYAYAAAAAFSLVVLYAPSIISARHIIISSPISPVAVANTKDGIMDQRLYSRSEGEAAAITKRGRIRGAAETTLQVAAGSRLPDCSRTCGSCSPCTLLVMISFVCSSLEEAETCPMSYKCICHNKSYPVP